jgi:hypothetical protein
MAKKMTAMEEKVAMAKYAAKGAAYQVKVNSGKGKLNSLDFRAASNAKTRTKDLNKLNDTSKTAGRAKNVESKLKKAAATKVTTKTNATKAKPTSGKIKITNVKVTTSGGPKPKTSVSGTSMVGGTKVTKPKKPLTSSEKAFLEGQKKKAKITKKTGIYPNTAN